MGDNVYSDQVHSDYDDPAMDTLFQAGLGKYGAYGGEPTYAKKDYRMGETTPFAGLDDDAEISDTRSAGTAYGSLNISQIPAMGVR